MAVRKELRVAGIVQGVGFRPYVYRLALERNLSGNVRNTSAGAVIEVQGAPESVDTFVDQLPQQLPTLARVTAVEVRELACREGAGAFEILPSLEGEPVHTLIAPDAATCDDCLRELFDPADRRYRYAFINCTHCGPRFTIVHDIPYDRARTSMSEFELCDACRAEYHDPRNRRFHAQPNACRDCGPQLQLLDAGGNRLAAEDPIAAAIARLRAGETVALKGLGGFHLAVDASNDAAVERLRERKHRGEKPFAVMAPSLEAAARLCHLDDAAREALGARQRPIVLLPRRADAPVSRALAPDQHELGLFLPYTPLHHLLFAGGDFTALVMTSGNLSEEPIAIDNAEAVQRLAGIADAFLVHDRKILLRCDDSVVRRAAGEWRQVRRSRGWVPAPIGLRSRLRPVLGVGGELKNTICLARGQEAFLSQHVGDLENPEACDFFVEAIAHLRRILELEPETVAHDLHPDYFPTQWALAQTGLKPVAVQHHHAHIASCMAENGLEGRVIGFACDGTGYGTDHAVWGGEALLASYSGFERAGQIEYLPLPGGAAAIREPWRMGLSYLAHTWGGDCLDLDIAFARNLPQRRAETILQMIERGLHSPPTSSCGRLFDGVAAILGLRQTVSYEGQAAMALEALAAQAPEEKGEYPFTLDRRGAATPWQIGLRPLFAAIVDDLRRAAAPAVIARRFHNGLAAVLTRLALRLRDASGLERVCLSGGTFNNACLLDQLAARLEAERFAVYTHRAVPAGDGGLSLGQAAIAGSE